MRKKWLAVVVGACGVAGAAIIVACSTHGDTTGQQASKLEIIGSGFGVAGDGSTSQQGLQNVSAVWSPFDASDTGGMFVLGTSMTRNTPVAANGEWMSWASSTFGDNPNYGNFMNPTMVGSADCLTKTILPDAGTFSGLSLMGAPSLAADGRGDVVYVGLGDTDGDPTNGAERVVAMISVDGGQHFNTMQFVNDDSGCSSGIQDLPHATFDTTVFPPELYVVWRHNGAGTFGGCIRHGSLNFSGTSNDAGCFISQPSIDWRGRNGGQSETVGPLQRFCANGPCFNGQGGMMVQAGDGAVTVMYAGNDAPPKANCAAFGAAVASVQGWATVTSYDEGVTWTNDLTLFLSTNYFWCMGDTSTQVFTGLRDFGFVRAGNGHLYAAVHDTPNTIRVFESANRGAGWREFCPANIGLQPDGGPSTPPAERQGTPWMQRTFVCPSADLIASRTDGGLASNGLVNTGLLWPTLAADGDTQTGAGVTQVAEQKSRVVLTWSQTLSLGDAGASPPFTQVVQGNADPSSPGFATNRFQPILPLSFAQQIYDPNTLPPPSAQNLLGQYNSIAVQYANVPCVEDAGGGTDPTILCHQSFFWPYWLENPNGGAIPNIRTRSVVITNP
jgi:hypothetical protein